MSKLFARLSTEEDETLVGGNDTAVEITEVVEAEATATEVTEDANEIEKDIVAMEEADEALVEINNQIAEDEVKLENPESVTAADALVSQESLRMTAKMLGASLTDLGITTISHESAKDSPVTALQLSTESAKEFFFKLVEQIKAIFSKIWNYIKKLAAKVYVMFNNMEKQASNMLEKLKNLQEKSSEDFTEDEQKRVVKLVGMPVYLNSKTTIDKDSIIGYIGGVGETATVSASAEGYDAIITKLEKVTGADKVTAKETYEAMASIIGDIEKSVVKGAYKNSIAKFITGAADKFTEVDGQLVQKIVPVSVKGGSVIAMYINIPKESNTTKIETVREMWNTLTIKKSTDKLDTAVFDGMAKGLKPFTKTDMTDILKQVKKNGSGMKKFVDDTLKSVETGSTGIKKLETIAKKLGNISGEKSSGLVKVASLMRATVTNLALSAIYDNVGGCKAGLAVCAISMKKYEKKD